MARQKRIAAPGYKGVFFVDSVSPATGEPDQIIYIRYKKDGKLYEEKVGRSSEKAPKPNQKKYWSPYLASLVRADRMRGKEMTNAERRAEKQAAKEAEAGRWTVTKLWGEYKAARPIKGIKTDEGRFNKFLAPAFGDKEPHEIDQLSVVRLRSKMLKDKAPQTVKNTLELLRRIVNFGVNARLCSPLPFKIEFPKCNNIVTEDLTPEQLQALMAAIENSKHPVAGPMMLCALFTGMRRGEMFRLKWTDLDFARGFIVIRDPKGGTDQTIPMNPRARELFETIPALCEWVFPGKQDEDGVYQQRVDIKKAVRTITRKAGIPDDFRALHGLRHVYASMLASSGQVDMYTLQKLMTHKSADMTARYAHLRDDALTKAGQVVDDIFKNLGKNGKVVELNGKK
ncbi:MAG: site-specific integrase [Desulfovibrionales bacterium]|nr:site-specific integrase [Desulfovibrionales bacterium]